jgi:hypothetical protein
MGMSSVLIMSNLALDALHHDSRIFSSVFGSSLSCRYTEVSSAKRVRRLVRLPGTLMPLSSEVRRLAARGDLEVLFEALQALAGGPERVEILAECEAGKDLADVRVLFAVELARG